MLMTRHAKYQTALGGLARQLVEEGLVASEKALLLQEEARQNDESFVMRLVSSRTVGATDLARTLSRIFAMPLLDLNAIDTAHAPIDNIPENLIRKHNALPIFQRGHVLNLAIADPTNLQALDDFRFSSGYQIQTVLVEQDKLEQTIEARFNPLERAMAGLDDLAANHAVDDSINLDDSFSREAGAEDAPVIRFVNKVMLDAIHRGASDIHFEPYEQRYRIRLRQDGVLHEVATPPVAISTRLSARLKVMARLDLAERRVPQDGRIKLNVTRNKSIDFRVSTCPTLYGEKIVLRILDPSSAQMGIGSLGYEDDQRAIFESTIQHPYGMVLVTGPTGSGKTVSLYTALNILNTPDRNISTAEDPAEINLPGVNQVNVAPRIGLTFSTCLRAFLRQDPDVIMVGEIRDLETAEIALKAAQTGHMVLSTLHTNDAPRTLTRLVNMGVPAYNIAASVTLIVAQRLARRLCPHCKLRIDPSMAAESIKKSLSEEDIGKLELFEANPRGCARCTDGYRGRIGIFQVMPVTEAIGEIIMANGTSADIDAQARKEGVIDLHEAGMNKVRAGIISLSELDRVIVE